MQAFHLFGYTKNCAGVTAGDERIVLSMRKARPPHFLLDFYMRNGCVQARVVAPLPCTHPFNVAALCHRCGNAPFYLPFNGVLSIYCEED